jgi:iron complex outermembrane receptor protein
VTFTDDANTVETLDPRGIIPGYALLAARIGVEAEDGRWRLSAFGRNLTNHTYYTATTVFVLNSVMSAGGFSAPGGFVGWYAPPRTYGVEASFKF